ncbi:Nmad2 family putative nucleotide modification protein [Pseudomonas putida]
MKLLTYVMTHDSGLAPNPFFGVCSLALCTPNYMNARLCVGDWVVGHSSKDSGNRLVYAMRLTKVLDMDEYYLQFPEKHPDPHGTFEQKNGDNMYFREGARWLRLPSAQHNCVGSFRQDQGRRVYLAEGEDHFWYFGAAHPNFEYLSFVDQFPWLIRRRQGIGYVRDLERIHAFAQALRSLGRSGLLGVPRDQSHPFADKYLISISPEPAWINADINVSGGGPVKGGCGRKGVKPQGLKQGC